MHSACETSDCDAVYEPLNFPTIGKIGEPITSDGQSSIQTGKRELKWAASICSNNKIIPFQIVTFHQSLPNCAVVCVSSFAHTSVLFFCLSPKKCSWNRIGPIKWHSNEHIQCKWRIRFLNTIRTVDSATETASVPTKMDFVSGLEIRIDFLWLFYSTNFHFIHSIFLGRFTNLRHWQS